MLPRLLLALLLITAQGIAAACGLTHATAHGTYPSQPARGPSGLHAEQGIGHGHPDHPDHPGHAGHVHASASTQASIGAGIIELGAHCDTCGSLVSAALPAPPPVSPDEPPLTAQLVPPIDGASLPLRIDAATRARAPPAFS